MNSGQKDTGMRGMEKSPSKTMVMVTKAVPTDFFMAISVIFILIPLPVRACHHPINSARKQRFDRPRSDHL